MRAFELIDVYRGRRDGYEKGVLKYPASLYEAWFGSGGSAHRLVIVSQRFRQVVVAAKWRGVSFEPIELFE